MTHCARLIEEIGGKTVSADFVGPWVPVGEGALFAIEAAIANDGGTLVGVVQVEMGFGDEGPSGGEGHAIWWFDAETETYVNSVAITTGTDFAHLFDLESSAPYVRIFVDWTSGASEDLGLNAKLFRKDGR